MKGLISFCLPAFNAAATLESVVQSLVAVEWPRKEIIIVDDGSTDHTFNVAKTIAKKHSFIRVFKLARNRGRGFARQFAMSKAHGELVAFMDADGRIKDKNWAKHMTARLSSPEIGGVFSLSRTLNARSSVARYWSLTTLASLQPGKLYATTGTGNTLVIRGAVRKSNAHFDERLDAAEDHDFFSQMHDNGYWFAYEPNALVERDQPDSFLKALRKRLYYLKWHGIRARLHGRLAAWLCKSVLQFVFWQPLTIFALAKSLYWYSKTMDVAVFWHVPMQAAISLAAPFIAVKSALTKTR